MSAPERAHRGTGFQPVIGYTPVGAGLKPAPTINSCTWDTTLGPPQKKKGEAQLPEPRLPPLGAQVLPAQAVFTSIFRGLAASTLASTKRSTPSFMRASILP